MNTFEDRDAVLTGTLEADFYKVLIDISDTVCAFTKFAVIAATTFACKAGRGDATSNEGDEGAGFVSSTVDWQGSNSPDRFREAHKCNVIFIAPFVPLRVGDYFGDGVFCSVDT